MTFLKALLFGSFLTFIVSEAIWAGKSRGGYLNISAVELSGHYVHWSWPLFIVATGLIWGILALME